MSELVPAAAIPVPDLNVASAQAIVAVATRDADRDAAAVKGQGHCSADSPRGRVAVESVAHLHPAAAVVRIHFHDAKIFSRTPHRHPCPASHTIAIAGEDRGIAKKVVVMLATNVARVHRRGSLILQNAAWLQV